MKLTKIATALLFLAPTYLPAATQDFTYRNGYKITVDQISPDVSIQIKNNKPTQSITTPNSKGVSHNYFSEFNVGKRGLNIDNAPSARVIINEVTGNNVSHLRGQAAIIGKQASLIIANPNGINCNNCAVSNVSQLILLAGNTVPDNTTGKLTGFKNITANVIVNNVKKNAIKSKLILTGNNIELNNSYINSPATAINVGLGSIDFSNSLRSQIADVNLTSKAKNYNADTRPLLSIDDDTNIRGNLTINADNAALVNNGKIITENINLNLMESQFSNDNHLDSSTVKINSKNSNINNSKYFSTENLNISYRENFNINNKAISSDNAIFSADKMLASSQNIKQYFIPNNQINNYKNNLFTIENDGIFETKQLHITGSQYDHITIMNDGSISTDKFETKGKLLTVFNHGNMLVRENFDVKDTDTFNNRSSNKIIIPQENINM